MRSRYLVLVVLALWLSGCTVLGENQTLTIFVPYGLTKAPLPTLADVARLAQVPRDCLVRIHREWNFQENVPLLPGTGIVLPIGGRIPQGWGSAPYNGPPQRCTDEEWRAYGTLAPSPWNNATVLGNLPLREDDPIFTHLPPQARIALRAFLGGGLLLIWLSTIASFFFIQVDRTVDDGRRYREVISDPGPFFGSVLWVMGMVVPIAFFSMFLSGLAHFISTRRTSFGGSGITLYTVLFVIIVLVFMVLALAARLNPAILGIIQAWVVGILSLGNRLFLAAYLWGALAAVLTFVDRWEDYSGNAALCILAGAVCVLWGYVPFLPAEFPPVNAFTGFFIWTFLGVAIFFFESAERQGQLSWRKDPLLLAVTISILTVGVVAQYGQSLIGVVQASY